jgi:hypothetical protein
MMAMVLQVAMAMAMAMVECSANLPPLLDTRG